MWKRFEAGCTALPGLEDSPTWSPDGRSIAYVTDAAGQLDIYVQQIAGGRAIRLTDWDADDAHPAWSPDGKPIYFDRNHQDIFVVPLQGGEPRAITDYHSFSILLDYPVMTADGKKIIFTRNDQGGDIFLLETTKQ